jgi:hypothetical protein
VIFREHIPSAPGWVARLRRVVLKEFRRETRLRGIARRMGTIAERPISAARQILRELRMTAVRRIEIRREPTPELEAATALELS